MVTPPITLRSGRVRSRFSHLLAGGTTGNEQLTALTGALLIVLLAIIGVTIISLRPLLSVHMFVGMLLLGPIALKLASTGYRFTAYYAGNARYRLKGPPHLALRSIAPLVVVTTVVVFASGVALLFAGPGSRDVLLPVHKISFIVWIPFMALHILGHLAELPHAVRTDVVGSSRAFTGPGGRAGRILSIAASLVAGTVLAILTIPQFQPWLHAHNLHHH